jgi:hypothetical protein
MFTWRIRWNRFREKVAMGIAWRLPKWLVYWVVIRLWAHATSGEYDLAPTHVTVDQALRAWDGQEIDFSTRF